MDVVTRCRPVSHRLDDPAAPPEQMDRAGRPSFGGTFDRDVLADARAIEPGQVGDQSVRTGWLNTIRQPGTDPAKKRYPRPALVHPDRLAAR